MTKQTGAMKLALEALERYQVKRQDFDRFADEITALREALAEQELMKNELAMREPSAIRDRLIQAGWTPPAQQMPLISTAHGPWIPSTHPGEEGESYCMRCVLRDKFLGSRQCEPHIVEQPPQTDWEAVAADQAMTIALLKAELQEFAEKQADSVEVALTESGWVWDGDQWQRPPQTWIELDHDDIHALLNEFFYKGMQPSGAHFANFARAIEAKLKAKNSL